MNSLDYFGHCFLQYIATLYVMKKENYGHGYSIIDVDGLPLCGLVPSDSSLPIHRLQIKESARC